MTNKELKEKIAHLESELAEVKEMAEGLKSKTNDGGVFKPKVGQDYWYFSSGGEIYDDDWDDALIDTYRYAIGNCFRTEQSAEDTVRALKLIKKARETQGGFVPDWENILETKYLLHSDGSGIWTSGYGSLNIAPIFGYWGDRSASEEFIKDNYDDIVWFFTEYQR